MLPSFRGLLINNWFLRSQHVVPRSLNETRKQGKVKVKVLHTFMGQSQISQWWLKELQEEIPVSWWENLICAFIDLCSAPRWVFLAFPRAHCFSFHLVLLQWQALDFKWILPELDEFLCFYLRSSHSLLLFSILLLK